IRGGRERLQQPNGATAWVRWEIRPWRHADGAIGGITISGEDVTVGVEPDQTASHGTNALARLHDAGWRLRLARSLQERLDEMLSATIELLGADMGCVQMLDIEATTLSLAIQYGFAPGLPKQLRTVSVMDATPAGRALRMRLPVVVVDTETDT